MGMVSSLYRLGERSEGVLDQHVVDVCAEPALLPSDTCILAVGNIRLSVDREWNCIVQPHAIARRLLDMFAMIQARM